MCGRLGVAPVGWGWLWGCGAGLGLGGAIEKVMCKIALASKGVHCEGEEGYVVAKEGL
jgi:hypothetical protein